MSKKYDFLLKGSNISGILLFRKLHSYFALLQKEGKMGIGFDLLRRVSGTLCGRLLSAECLRGKQKQDFENKGDKIW